MFDVTLNAELTLDGPDKVVNVFCVPLDTVPMLDTFKVSLVREPSLNVVPPFPVFDIPPVAVDLGLDTVPIVDCTDVALAIALRLDGFEDTLDPLEVVVVAFDVELEILNEALEVWRDAAEALDVVPGDPDSPLDIVEADAPLFNELVLRGDVVLSVGVSLEKAPTLDVLVVVLGPVFTLEIFDKELAALDVSAAVPALDAMEIALVVLDDALETVGATVDVPDVLLNPVVVGDARDVSLDVNPERGTLLALSVFDASVDVGAAVEIREFVPEAVTILDTLDVVITVLAIVVLDVVLSAPEVTVKIEEMTLDTLDVALVALDVALDILELVLLDKVVDNPDVVPGAPDDPVDAGPDDDPDDDPDDADIAVNAPDTLLVVSDVILDVLEAALDAGDMALEVLVALDILEVLRNVWDVARDSPDLLLEGPAEALDNNEVLLEAPGSVLMMALNVPDRVFEILDPLGVPNVALETSLAAPDALDVALVDLGVLLGASDVALNALDVLLTARDDTLNNLVVAVEGLDAVLDPRDTPVGAPDMPPVV